MHKIVLCTVFIYFAQVLSIDVPDQFLDTEALDCIKETNVDKKKLATVLDENLYVKSEDPEIYAMFECSTKKHNMLKDNGEFDGDKLIKEINKNVLPFFKKTPQDNLEIATNAFNNCKDKKGDSLGKRFVNFHNCIVDEVRKT